MLVFSVFRKIAVLSVAVPKCFIHWFCRLRKKLGKINVVGREMSSPLGATTYFICTWMFHLFQCKWAERDIVISHLLKLGLCFSILLICSTVVSFTTKHLILKSLDRDNFTCYIFKSVIYSLFISCPELKIRLGRPTSGVISQLLLTLGFWNRNFGIYWKKVYIFIIYFSD